MITFIQAAGWPIWPLLLCSVLALTLIVERGLNLRRVRVCPNGLMDNVLAAQQAQLKENRMHQTLSPEELEPLAKSSSLGALLATGLMVLEREANTPVLTDSVLDAFEKQLNLELSVRGREIAMDLERNLQALATLASAAPLLGLLGTVVGMIEIFAAQSQGSPSELGLGISMALYNTAMGLCVAIPSLIFWRFYKSQVDRYVMELESAAEKMQLLWVQQKRLHRGGR